MRAMIKKSLCIVVFASAFFSTVSAQSGYLPTNPIAAPTVSPPAMTPMPTIGLPTVTAPTVTGPSVTSAGTATGTANGTATGSTTAAGTTSTGATSKGTTSSSATSSTAATALSLLGLGSDNSLLSALNGTGTDDSSTSALSSLFGSGTTSTADSATLTKILELLEKQQAQADATAKTAAAAGTETAADKAHITSGGELIRFTVNGYSITATTLVSSILAKDGSFLLTGDRGATSSTQKITETFYLLCRKNVDGTYRLQADVSQNPVNANSYLYQLARRSPIKGTLTGDLLVFRTDDPSWSLNLVIRIINPSVVKTSVR